MLHLGEPLAIGRTRTIYPHPERPGWLIKVENNLSYRDTGKFGTVWRKALGDRLNLASENQRELKIYQRFSGALSEFVPIIEAQFIATNQGQGLVCQQVLNDDGSPSPSIADKLLEGPRLTPQLIEQLEILFALMLDKDLFFFDLNLDNFLIQQSNGQAQIRFIDLKSYRRDRAPIPLTKLSRRLAKAKMQRRISKFFDKLSWYGHS